MSLLKQLYVAITLILALVAGGSFVLSTLSSKYYLEQQLQMKNDDNATTLALSMTQLKKDPVTIDLLISAQFDSGHYQSIRLSDPNGKVLSERINNNSQTKAPQWFTKLIPIRLQAGVAEIQDGWSQYGTLRLESDANFAYDKLWDATIMIALWSLLIGLLSCYAYGKILNKVLKPLDDVVNQAKSIGENRFVIIDVPKTKEFKALVNAMNTLSNRVKKTVSEESARLEQLRVDNHYDQVTGLMNHDSFIKSVDASISHEEYFHTGAIVISRMLNLSEIDKRLGHEKTNALLRSIGSSLEEHCRHNPELSAGRLSGTEFSVFSNLSVDSYTFGNQIKTLLEKVSLIDETSGSISLSTVVTQVTNTDSAVGITDLVHQSLDSIGSAGGDSLHVINSNELEQHHNNDQSTWHNLLTSALDNKRIKLETYPVVDKSGKLIHYESPVRLQLVPNGKWSPAGEFITWAIQLRLMDRIDKLVLETAVDSLSHGAQPIGLNVAASAMCNTKFVDAMINLIKAYPKIANKLYLEVPEHGAFDQISDFRNFCLKLKNLGCKVGIEHVSSRISRLGELHDIGLDYIKIDASIIKGIDSNEANKTLLRGLCMIAHSIGVQAIAEGVQNTEEITTLKQIGIDGMTGPGIVI